MGQPGIIVGVTLALRSLADRQKVIAGNIANSETPGYKAKDVAPPDFGALLNVTGSRRVVKPTVSITSGMAALGATPPTAANIVPDADIGEVKPDGNNVTLEDQLMRMGQVQADFTALTSIYRKQMGLMKSALGRPGGS